MADTQPIRVRTMLALCAAALLLCVVAFPLLSHIAAAAATIDAESYDVRNPKIILNYTDPVLLVTKSLIAKDVDNPVHDYPLCQVPSGTPPTFEKGYYLYTKKTAIAPDCSDGEIVPLVPGRYQLTLQAVNPQGDYTKPNDIDVKEFIINGLDINLQDPASGIANHHPFDVIFTTNNESVCRYAFTNLKFDQMRSTIEGETAGKTHTLRSVDYRGDMFVICQEPSGRQTPAKFVIGWDSSPPRVTASATPMKVIDPRFKYTSVRVVTDDNSTCWFDGTVFPRGGPPEPDEDLGKYYIYNTTHDLVHYYNEITDNAPHNFTYPIRCRNLAGLENSTTLNVTVNFGDFVFIDVLDPPTMTNDPSIHLRARPTFLADSCEANGEAMTEDSKDSTIFMYDFSGVEGKNTFLLNCTGAKESTRQYNVTVDTTPPEEPTLNASAMICANTITAKFNSTDRNGILSYTYTVSDARGRIANGTQLAQVVSVPLKRPIVAPLRWEVYATDLIYNNGTAATQEISDPVEGEDEACGLPAFISIESPNLGFSRTKPYSLVLGTLRPSECRYTLQQGVPWSAMTPFSPDAANTTHTKGGLTLADALVYVACNETDGSYHKKTVHVGVDNSSPRIAITTDPNPVIDPMAKIVTLTVVTDDDTYCTHNSSDGPGFTTLPDTAQAAYTREHTTLFDYRAVTNSAMGRRPFKVTCKNLAFLENSSASTIIINLGANLSIKVLSPPKYTAESDITLKIKPNKIATCTWQKSGASDTAKAFTTIDAGNNTMEEHLGALEDGGHSYVIECTAADGVGSTVAQFVIDKTPPTITALTGPSVICPATDATYHYNVSGFDLDPIISYSLERSDGAGASFQDNTTDDLITLSITGLDSGNYTLSLTPINHANVTGTPKTMEVSIKGRTDEACNQPPNHCTNRAQDPGEEGPDCGGTCPNACISCVASIDCPTGMECIENVCVATDACIDDSVCNAGEQCINGKCSKTICTSNTDCFGGTTICVQGACVVPQSCTTDTDCLVGVCKESICVLPECGDGVKDGNETGIDCGGACAVCVACTNDTGCIAPQTCREGVCASPTSCTLNADCDATHVCQEGKCIPIATCQGDEECPEGLVCTAYVCSPRENPRCTSNVDCDPGMICNTETGACEAKQGCASNADCPQGQVCDAQSGNCQYPPDPCANGVKDPDETDIDCGGSCAACKACTTNDDCPSGKICGAGNVCIPGSRPQPPESSKSYLLSILLIVFGIAIMGGAGYFLYEQNEEKKAVAARQAAAAYQAASQRGRGGAGGGPGGMGGGPGRPQMDPAQLAKFRAEQAAKAQAMREELAKRSAEKAAQRSSLFSGFDGLVDGKAAEQTARAETGGAADSREQVSAATTPDKKAAATQNEDTASGDAGQDDDYVDITALSKKGKQGADATAKSEKPDTDAKSDDATGGKQAKSAKKDAKGSAGGGADETPKENPKDDDAFNELDSLGK